MEISFYTAAIGAQAHQQHLDVLANNMSNVNTYGFKAKKVVFADLLYNRIHPENIGNPSLEVGSGAKIMATNTSFEEGGVNETEGTYDYSIKGDGFFALQDPITDQITYTRNGNFSLSEKGDVFYLVSEEGYNVLDGQQKPIIVKSAKDLDTPEVDEDTPLSIGVFRFEQKNGLENVGNDRFINVAKNGAPILVQGDVLQKGKLEGSNVDMPFVFSKIIETQRAYQYALKMVQTSDEIVGLINSLR